MEHQPAVTRISKTETKKAQKTAPKPSDLGVSLTERILGSKPTGSTSNKATQVDKVPKLVSVSYLCGKCQESNNNCINKNKNKKKYQPPLLKVETVKARYKLFFLFRGSCHK